MLDRLSGKAFVCSPAITAYDIIPESHWYGDTIDQASMGPWAFEELVPGILGVPYGFRDMGYQIVVAGSGFGGGGKSIEHPIYALKGAGIRAVIAESFARYNFRNSINKGLPVISCPGITAFALTGDELTVDFVQGTVENRRTGERISFPPFAPFVTELLEAGGLLEYTKKKIFGKEERI